jgi:hypothetical protein
MSAIGKIRLVFMLLAAGIAAMTFSACGSGGGGGSAGGGEAVAALDLPSRITLSSAEGTSNSAAAIAGSSLRKLARKARLNVFNDAGSDYTNEQKISWLEDTDALDTLNDVLGVVKESGYENFINAGPYKALVQKVGDSESSQGGTTSTSTTAEELLEIIVDVTRDSNTSPMITKVWVREENGPGGGTMMIRGYLEVSAGVSADYPYGVMQAHFKGNALDANGAEVAGDPLFTMVMSIGAENGQVIVELLEQGSEDSGGPVNFEWDRRLRLVADATLSSGKAYVYNAETNDHTGLLDAQTLYFAYNGDFFKYQDTESLEVTTQDKNSLVHRIYKYKLFREDTGARVTRSSGFPIRTAGGQYGYVGYYGLWVPQGFTTADGDTVTRVDNGQAYTLIKKGGKLVRHTRNQTTLGALEGLEISVWDQASGRDIIVVWNGAAGAFKKIGERSSTTGQIQYLEEENYTVYTFANAWEGGWCQALNAPLPLGLIEAPTGATVIYYHSQETVSGAQAADLTLYYWGYAMTAPITQEDVDSANTDEMTYRMTPPAVRKTYTFDAVDLVLEDESGNPMLFNDGIDLSGTTFGGGCTMMHLTIDDTYTAENSYDIGNAETYYSWTFGPNSWNQFTALQEAGGALVSFETPLNFAYTHSQANDANADATYDGKFFSLSYDGSGLNIPWLFDAASGDWAPVLNLKDGTVLEDSDGNRYVVKAVEEALLMSTTSDPAADALVIDTSVAAPTLTYDATKTALVGAVPADAVLEVIKGELID